MTNGSTPNEGFIEVKGSNGAWGGICDNGWSQPDADVVCRMLGYPSAETVYKESKPFGHGTGTFVLDWVGCVGNETSVFDCPAVDRVACGGCGCNNQEWAGVKCNDAGD